MISSDDIYKSTQGFLTEHLQVSPDLIAPDATLDDLGVDSLAAVELFLHLKGEFAVDVDEGAADPSLTLAQTVALFTAATTNDTASAP